VDWSSLIDVNAGTLESILPAGGKAVLDSKESVPAQQSPEAQALIEGLLTDDCKAAIYSGTAHKYASGMAELVSIEKSAKEKALLSFTSQLRAWPAAVQEYWLATNERDNTTVQQALVDLQTAATEKMAGSSPYLNDASKLAQQSKEVKTAETALFKSQIQKGGGYFPLDEFNFTEENAKQIGWFGPVSVRERVAKVVKVADPKKTGIQFVYQFPDIPDQWLWYMGGKENNPDFVSAIPGYADIAPHSAYTIAKSKTFNWDSEGEELSVFEMSGTEYAVLDEYLSEQVKRIYDIEIKPYQGFVSETGDIIPKQTVISDPPCGVLLLLIWGKHLDPEWGGMESENVYYEKTYLEIANALTPELRKRQDQRRIELRKGGVFGSETGAGEQYAYFKKVRKVEEAVSTAALFPPVRTKLKKG
jgi:hypothetical protein